MLDVLGVRCVRSTLIARIENVEHRTAQYIHNGTSGQVPPQPVSLAAAVDLHLPKRNADEEISFSSPVRYMYGVGTCTDVLPFAASSRMHSQC